MCVCERNMMLMHKIDLYCNFLINEKIYFVDRYIFQINFMILRYFNILLKKIFAQNKLFCFNSYVPRFLCLYYYEFR